VTGTCPAIASGTLTFAGQQVQIWAGSGTPAQPGALVIFWYGTGGSTTDAEYIFGQTQIDAVTAAGGLVAAIGTSNKQGTDTGDAVWYTGDFDTADQVVACALQQKLIDSRRIYTVGDSAGGLQATWMAYARSGYIAAVAPLSGGLVQNGGVYAAPVDSPQDPSNVPSAIVTHGAEGVDVFILDFSVTSAAYEADIATKGGFSVDCNTGGGHVSGPPVVCPALWQFFQDHPFKAKDDYSSGLPSSFPSYCGIGPREPDGGAE
jgi:poly(3-hydroxybutyrate) depolymerase